MFVPLTPVRFLDRAVELYGHKTGVVCGDRSFTYGEFGARVRRLASALPCVGVRERDRVAFLSFNNHQLLEGYYGVPQARAVLLPLNVRLAPAELAEILNHSGARVLFFEREFAAVVAGLRAACRGLAHCVSLDGKAAPAELEYEELLEMGRPEPADIMSYDEAAPAELFYTSGSTGKPKGVLLAHRTLFLHALEIVAGLNYDDTSVELHTIPLFHANGWGRAHITTMLGVRQVMVRRFGPEAVFRLIEEHRVTDMSLVPTMAVALLAALGASQPGRFDFSSLRLIHIGGAPSSPQLIARMERAFGCRTVAGYGLTETSPVVSTGRGKSTVTPRSDEERFARQATAGLPFPGVEVRVVDAQMREAPRDGRTAGELLVRGDGVMDGYFADEEATAAAISEGWLRTGDVAVRDEEGYIQIVDRRKDIIISGGENISSVEVEKAILEHPAVYECAVVAAPDEVWGEAPAAIVVRRAGASLSAEELAEFLAGRVAKFKVPRRIEIVDEELPKTGTGKIRKIEIRERFWAGLARRVH